MNSELTRKFDELTNSLLKLQKASKQLLGFTDTIEYRNIVFHVSQRFVIADLSPLAFIDLVQDICVGDAHTAVVQLHDRLKPLLECRHEWHSLNESHDTQPLYHDTQPLYIDAGMSLRGTRISRCALCTACGLDSRHISLPIVGRGMKDNCQ